MSNEEIITHIDSLNEQECDLFKEFIHSDDELMDRFIELDKSIKRNNAKVLLERLFNMLDNEYKNLEIDSEKYFKEIFERNFNNILEEINQ